MSAARHRMSEHETNEGEVAFIEQLLRLHPSPRLVAAAASALSRHGSFDRRCRWFARRHKWANTGRIGYSRQLKQTIRREVFCERCGLQAIVHADATVQVTP